MNSLLCIGVGFLLGYLVKSLLSHGAPSTSTEDADLAAAARTAHKTINEVSDSLDYFTPNTASEPSNRNRSY